METKQAAMVVSNINFVRINSGTARRFNSIQFYDYILFNKNWTFFVGSYRIRTNAKVWENVLTCK